MTAQAKIPDLIRYNCPPASVLTIFGITEEIHRVYVAEVVAFINKNYNKDISLNQLTQKAYLSKFHFSRVFKRHTSYSPYQYLITVRLNHASDLLLNSNYSVKEVADLCGFKRLDYFSAVFKKKFKYSPSMYRENYPANA